MHSHPISIHNSDVRLNKVCLICKATLLRLSVCLSIFRQGNCFRMVNSSSSSPEVSTGFENPLVFSAQKPITPKQKITTLSPTIAVSLRSRSPTRSDSFPCLYLIPTCPTTQNFKINHQQSQNPLLATFARSLIFYSDYVTLTILVPQPSDPGKLDWCTLLTQLTSLRTCKAWLIHFIKVNKVGLG